MVDTPKNQKLVGCKCIFKRKRGIPGIEDARYKARLVAKGFTQRELVYYNEIFSSVVKPTLIRMILAIVTQHDMELDQMDVKTAFLHGELQEKIYMRPPETFTLGKTDQVCLLK